jgi:hypothetical protein
MSAAKRDRASLWLAVVSCCQEDKAAAEALRGVVTSFGVLLEVEDEIFEDFFEDLKATIETLQTNWTQKCVEIVKSLS